MSFMGPFKTILSASLGAKESLVIITKRKKKYIYIGLTGVDDGADGIQGMLGTGVPWHRSAP